MTNKNIQETLNRQADTKFSTIQKEINGKIMMLKNKMNT
jgi:hypothetical protein